MTTVRCLRVKEIRLCHKLPESTPTGSIRSAHNFQAAEEVPALLAATQAADA